MLSINRLAMLYGARLLFDDVNLNLLAQCRYAVVGANGTGKSTFLRLIGGEEIPSLGDILIPKRSRVGWLKQDQYRYENQTPVQVVLQGKPELWEALVEKEQLLASTEFTEAMGYRLASLEEIILREEGYTADTLARTLLTGLGVKPSLQDKPINALSGGYKLRVLLAQALFSNPDILLLDEPTNHLDIMSIAWLERYLKETFKGVLIFISHDHGFLNNLSTHVLDIDYGEIREYVGNYDSFLIEKQQVVERKMAEKKALEAKIAHMQSFVDRFRASATRSRQAKAREKMIEKIELPDIKNSSRIAPTFVFKQKRPSGKLVLTIEGIEKKFGMQTVLSNVSFKINRGEKVALIGHNGIGKSTLLKILMGSHSMDAGKFEWGHEAHTAYFAQDHHEQLTLNQTALEWLTERRSNVATNEMLRRILGQMLFQQDDVYKLNSTLSGGEAARLLFADIMMQNANIMILDEPTNHLDIESRDALALALKQFEGTLLFVSHDRYFVSAIATRIIALTEGKVVDFHGSYEDYLSKYGEDYLSQAWMLSQ